MLKKHLKDCCKTLPCTDNSLLTGDDSDPGDAYEYRRRRKVDPAASCRDSVRYRVPCAPDRRPFALRRRNNSRDYDPIPFCPPVSEDTPCAAISIKKLSIIMFF